MSENDYYELRKNVCEANIRLSNTGLVPLTWGNVSGFDGNLVAIKPSGVGYDKLTPDDIPVLNLEGKVLYGHLHPSSDTPTHLELYRSLPQLKGIVHTHSRFAVVWAQLGRDIPCYGTTHADCFNGPIPCTDLMTEKEVVSDYELNTGKVAVRKINEIGVENIAGLLIRSHGPFVWGDSPDEAVDHAVALEEIAAMAWYTEFAGMQIPKVAPDYLVQKHYLRKHGSGAYYGQGAK